MIIECIGGYIANSLAIMTDASHLLSDLCSFLISLFAISVAKKTGTMRLSYGYHRAEILGALISIVLIWIVTAWLVYEAILRCIDPPEVDGKVMLITSSIGMIANVVMTILLGVDHHHDHDHDHDHEHDHEHDHDHNHNHIHDHDHGDDTHSHSHSRHELLNAKTVAPSTGADGEYVALIEDGEGKKKNNAADNASSSMASLKVTRNVNLQAAYIHALGDLIQNLGVMMAAAIIYFRPEYRLADPICTFIFSILVMYTTYHILIETTNVLMEGVPTHVDSVALEQELALIPHVKDVHDLHIWSLSVGKPSLTCHILVESSDHAADVLVLATRICQRHYNILHTTIQIDSVTTKACETAAHAKCYGRDDESNDDSHHHGSHGSHEHEHDHNHKHDHAHEHGNGGKCNHKH